MKHSEELENLAKHLDDKALIAYALADDHERNSEPVAARQQRRRAENARHYADVCRESAKMLAKKEKRAGFVPPSREDLVAFVRDKGWRDWPLADMDAWYNHFESVGWVVGKGNPMKQWQAAAANGYARWKRENPSAKSAVKSAEDDPRWGDWCSGRGYPYERQSNAPEYRRKEFAAWKSAH